MCIRDRVNFEWYGSQTATVMALQFGMVPNDKIASVVKGLKYNIEAVKGGHHSTGIHGNRYIYTVLNKLGHADLAHEILTTPTFPSQTYIMNYGFTTWPERQFYWDEMEGLTNSLNHPMHSGFAAYFFEMLGGIKSSVDKPGYKEFTVNPVAADNITNTSVIVPTPYGNIKNSWEKTDSDFSMNLAVPFNTKASIFMDKNEMESLKIDGIKLSELQKVNKIEIRDSNVILGSGIYQIDYVTSEK
jgi:alpha-L-rhamnosidase